MTCIVGLEHRGVVYIGADSHEEAEGVRTILATPKIYTISDSTKKAEAVFGIAGYAIVANILQYEFTLPTPLESESDVAFAHRTMRAITALLLKEIPYKPDARDAAILMGYRGAVYVGSGSGDTGLSVTHGLRGYAAVGSGASYAKAYLWSTKASRMKPLTRIENALKAATEFDSGVSPPYVVIKHPKAKGVKEVNTL